MILYSNNCPNCIALKNILDNKNIKYEIVSDMKEIMNFARQNGLATVPILKTEDAVMNFTQAKEWLEGENIC